MKLYHGTSGRIGRLATLEGLKPRRAKNNGNWENAPSRRDAVYLTVAYAPYFAMNADNHSTEIAIVEIDTDRLDQGKLVPDEDAIEQINRLAKMDDGCRLDWSVLKRTEYYREKLHNYTDGQWKTSLQILGNCAHIGNIRPDAITQVALLDVKDHREWAAYCLNPIISLMNFRFMSLKYTVMTEALFGYDIAEEPEDEKIIRKQVAELSGNKQSYRNPWDVIRDLNRDKITIIRP